MPEIQFFMDMIEENGKTVRENNLSKTHNIPIGTLVEVKYDKWFGNGGCKKVHARMWVCEHGRDCDGTPLYSLSEKKDLWPIFSERSIPVEDDSIRAVPSEWAQTAMSGVCRGFPEESLTIIKETEDILSGKDSLNWMEK